MTNSSIDEFESQTVTKRFDFRNSFDSNERGMVAARDYTLEDVESALAQGFEQGKAAGLAESEASLEQSVSSAMTNLSQSLQSLVAELEEIRTETELDALRAVTAIVKKVVPHYATKHGFEEVEALLQECLSAVHEEPRIVARVHDSVLESLREKINELVSASGFNGNVVLFSDDNLAPGDCRIEWADGGAERDVDRLWQEIDAVINRFIDGPTQADTGLAAE